MELSARMCTTASAIAQRDEPEAGSARRRGRVAHAQNDDSARSLPSVIEYLDLAGHLRHDEAEREEQQRDRDHEDRRRRQAPPRLRSPRADWVESP